jgi:hypothetical protein
MARHSVFTRRLEVRGGVVREQIRGFHSGVSVLAVGYCVPWGILNEVHFSETTSRVLDVKVLGLQLVNQVHHMLISLVTELSVITDRH